jgi:hypothetical protein
MQGLLSNNTTQPGNPYYKWSMNSFLSALIILL